MDCTFSNPFSANIFTNWLLGASTASVMLLAFKRTNFFKFSDEQMHYITTTIFLPSQHLNFPRGSQMSDCPNCLILPTFREPLILSLIAFSQPPGGYNWVRCHSLSLKKLTFIYSPSMKTIAIHIFEFHKFITNVRLCRNLIGQI